MRLGRSWKLILFSAPSPGLFYMRRQIYALRWYLHWQQIIVLFTRLIPTTDEQGNQFKKVHTERVLVTPHRWHLSLSTPLVPNSKVTSTTRKSWNPSQHRSRPSSSFIIPVASFSFVKSLYPGGIYSLSSVGVVILRKVPSLSLAQGLWRRMERVNWFCEMKNSR